MTLLLYSMNQKISEGNKKSESILCDRGYIWFVNRCIVGKRIGEICMYSAQCQYYDVNTFCDEKSKCNNKCDSGFMFSSKAGKCIPRIIDAALEKTLREYAVAHMQRNNSSYKLWVNLTSSNLLPKTILYDTSGSYSLCAFDQRWNKFTQQCEINPFLVNTGTLMISFGFAMAFIFIILMVSKKRRTQNSSHVANQNLGNGLNAEINPLFIVCPPEERLPSYQDVINSYPNNELPSYEEAVNFPRPKNIVDV